MRGLRIAKGKGKTYRLRALGLALHTCCSFLQTKEAAPKPGRGLDTFCHHHAFHAPLFTVNC